MNPDVIARTRTRQQVWEDEYRANPYLAGKPESHILERFRYLIQCTTTLTETGQIGFETRERLMPYLLRRQSHIQMELGSRGGVPEHAISREDLPKVTHPEKPAGTRAYQERKRPEVGQLFKFGERRWLQAMLERGSIRFAPASSYSSPTFNNAIRDDELTFTYYPGEKSPPLKVLRHHPETDWMQIRHPSDFYLQCFTDRFAVGASRRGQILHFALFGQNQGRVLGLLRSTFDRYVPMRSRADSIACR